MQTNPKRSFISTGRLLCTRATEQYAPCSTWLDEPIKSINRYIKKRPVTDNCLVRTSWMRGTGMDQIHWMLEYLRINLQYQHSPFETYNESIQSYFFFYSENPRDSLHIYMHSYISLYCLICSALPLVLISACNRKLNIHSPTVWFENKYKQTVRCVWIHAKQYWLKSHPYGYIFNNDCC